MKLDIGTARLPIPTDARTGASMSRHNSKQDVGTPREFIAAAEKRFGAMAIDLAADRDNAKAPRFITEAEDSLAANWEAAIYDDENAWLNPPFADIAPWAAKCAAWLALRRRGRILLLTPASVGTNWFADHVHGKAYVLGLQGRITFVGSKDPYPKDLMLSVFDPATGPGFDLWNWRKA